MQFNKVNIPKLARNQYDYVAQGSVGGTTIISGGSGGTDSVSRLIEPIYSDDGEICGIRALYSMSVQGGVNIYTGGEGTNSPSIYDGLPIDNITLYWDNGVLKSKGSDGMDEGKLKTYLDSNSYINNGNKSNYLPAWALAANKPAYTWAEISNKPSWIGVDKPGYSWAEIGSKPSWIGVNKPSYVWTEIGGKPSWIGDNKPTYAFFEIGGKPTTLSGYGITDAVTLNTSQAITGAKDFTGGLSVDGCPIAYDTATKVWKITGNLLVTGGITQYGDILTGSAILDALPVDATLSKANGVLSVVGGGFLSSITVKLGTVAYDSVSGVVSLPAYPTTLPASDVPAWAKASSKPSYVWAEIGGKPTTLGGYGITDALSINGNAVSASKLQTQRAIWGQKFDGTSDVNGHLWLGTSILYGHNNIAMIRSYTDGNTVLNACGGALYLGDTNTNSVTLRSGGNSKVLYFSDKGYLAIGNYTPSITLALGDSDTGFNWVSDGDYRFVANGQTAAGITSSGFYAYKTLYSAVTGGTAPISVSTTAMCPNLNAQYPGGRDTNNYTWGKLNGESGDLNDIAIKYPSMIGMFIKSDSASSYPESNTNWHFIYQSSYNMAGEASNLWKSQIAVRSLDAAMFVRARSGGSDKIANWTAWHKVLTSNTYNAYSPSLNGTGAYGSWNINASTATALQTARTLWGQSFRGDGNVSGTLSNVADINMSGNLKFSTSGYHALCNSSGYQVVANNGQGSFFGGAQMTLAQLQSGAKEFNLRNDSGIDTNVDRLKFNIYSFNIANTYGDCIKLAYNATYQDYIEIAPKGANTSLTGGIIIGNNGTVYVRGNLLVEGGITQYSNGISTTDTFSANTLKANNCLLVGTNTVLDANTRYINCMGKTGYSYISFGYSNSQGNSGELAWNYVGNNSGDNMFKICAYGYSFADFYVSGNHVIHNNLRVTGSFSYTSDVRKKNIVRFIDYLSIDQIANAPIFDFTWKDNKDLSLNAGTSAQYWKEIFPNSVKTWGDSYSIDGSTSLVCNIVIARELQKLKQENEELRQEINKLKERAS